MADPRGGAPLPLPDQNFLNFMQFFGKIWQICLLAPPPGGLAPHPTRNPRSVPAMIAFNCLTNTVVIQRKITLIIGAMQLFVHGASYLFIDFIVISPDEISTNKSSNKGVNLKAL